MLGRALSLPGWLMGGLTIAFLAWPLYLMLRRTEVEEGAEVTS
jgi:hypothetical protein